MFKTVQEAFQYLVQQYRQNTGKFPIGKQIDDLMNQAKQMFSKETLTLTDEVKPTFSVVDEKKLPKAQIEALPLSDKEKAAAAVKKKIDAQNVQAKQSIEGGESSGGQRGAPELVDENFGQTLYIDSSEMMQIMDDAQRKFDAASDAVARGDYDDARAILRFEIEDNYKLPQATRDAAYDARVFIRRGEGIDPKEMGYETMEETLEALNEQIAKGVQTTYQDNWPLYTAPDDASNMKSIEYVDFLDEAGEDFGTPNSQIITPADMSYEYADGGRVGFNEGGPASAKDFIESTGDSELMDIYIKVLDGTLPEDALTKALEKKGYKTYATGGRVGFSIGGGVKASQMLMNLYNKLVKDGKASRAVREFFEEKLAEIINVEKMGVTKPADVDSILKEAQEISKKQYQSKMEPIKEGDLEGVMTALPVDKVKVMKQRTKASKDKEGIQQLADDNQIPVRDDTKTEYKFTGRETQDDLYELEEKGIISRADHNVYGDRYLDYLDARVKYYYGYTKGQMNKIKNQPARLNYLRAQVDPNWGEANFGEDYLRILEKARGEEIKITNPGKDKSGPFDHIFEKMYKPVRDEIEGVAPEATSAEKLYDEYIYYRDELGNFKGSFDDFIIARRKAGSLDAEQTPLSTEAVKRKQNASGGLAYLMGL